jgi:catechol 2,3-dioxygenase-like lactoylglutathione lyase family enzyme
MTDNEPAPPPLQGIHHLKLPVTDLDTSLAFYQRAFGARRIPEADHRRASDGSLYAYILAVPGLGTALELRLDPGRAERHRLSDPVTTAVGDRATLAARDQYLTGRASSTPRSSPLSRPGSLSCPTRTATGCASAR